MVDEQQPDDSSPELDRILVEYYQRVDAGETIDKDQFLAEHPEHAEALAEFLSAEQQLQPEPVDSTLQNTPTILSDNLNNPEGEIPSVLRYFGDYELLEEIARGGMGIVYKARQTSLNRTVAVKMILAGRLARDSDVQRFRVEAEAAAKLQHPNIVQIYEVGEQDGQHYFSMEYIDGSNLAEMVRDYPLPAREAAQTVSKVAEAIEYAHQQGVLHRDLKPSNVLIDARSEEKVTDFGLAKLLEGDQQLTQTDQILGTPSYMPPEQALGNQALMGPTADVYSLGAVLYHLLTGRPPFAAATQVETIHQVIHHEPVSPRLLEKSLPKDLETICQKCLQKEPHRRYGRSQELAEDLQRFLDDRPVVARPVSRVEKSWRWCQRNPLVPCLVAISISYSVFLILLYFLKLKERWQLDKARGAERWLGYLALLFGVVMLLLEVRVMSGGVIGSILSVLDIILSRFEGSLELLSVTLLFVIAVSLILHQVLNQQSRRSSPAPRGDQS